MPNNDLIADAYHLAVTGGTYTGDPIDNTTYTKASPEPDLGASLTRTGWFYYRPVENGTLSLSCVSVYADAPGYEGIAGTPASATLRAYLDESGAPGGVEGTGYGASAACSFAVITGVRYLIRVASTYSDPQVITLSATGPDSVADVAPLDPNLDVPPISSTGAVTARPQAPVDAPPISASVISNGFSAAPDTTPDNHLLADAFPIGKGVGGYYESTVDNTDHIEPDPDVVGVYSGDRASWWSYSPTSVDEEDNLMAVAAEGLGGDLINLRLFELVDGELTQLADESTDPDPENFYPNPYADAVVQAGHTYYVRIANLEGSGQLVNMTLTGPPSSNPLLAAPAITAGVRLPTSGLTAPPISVTTNTTAVLSGRLVLAPAITTAAAVPSASVAGSDVIAPDEVIVRVAPGFEAVVAVARPAFVVGINEDTDQAYTVEVQYADNSALTDSVTLSTVLDPTEGGVTITPGEDVPAATYWRVRVLDELGAVAHPYTSVWSFTVSVGAISVAMPVTWTVEAGADTPIHLWHVWPPAAEPGDTATIYGHGFPSTPTVTIGATAVTVISTDLVPADATADERIIDNDVVHAEHYEVVITVPDVDEPGGPLEVGI